jgi:hypothetical protein
MDALQQIVKRKIAVDGDYDFAIEDELDGLQLF